MWVDGGTVAKAGPTGPIVRAADAGIVPTLCLRSGDARVEFGRGHERPPKCDLFSSLLGWPVMPVLDHIFKAYDVRGTVPDQLDDHLAHAIGAGFARFVLESAHAAGESVDRVLV